jgi:hypothetical protein
VLYRAVQQLLDTRYNVLNSERQWTFAPSCIHCVIKLLNYTIPVSSPADLPSCTVLLTGVCSCNALDICSGDGFEA